MIPRLEYGIFSNNLILFFIIIFFPVISYSEFNSIADKISSSEAQANKLPVANPDIILTLQGSNTIGQSLAPKLAIDFLRSIDAKEVMVVKGSIKNETVIQADLPSFRNVIGVKIKAHGSGTAFRGFEDNSIDIGMSSRSINDSEKLRLLVSHGDLTLPENETVLGMDGIAVIVHPQNPVSKLSITQLSDIFSGNIKNWSELGGNNSPIHLYSRDDNSGTYDTFSSLVLKPHQLSLSEDAKRFESNQELSKEVYDDKDGIGFTGMAYVLENKVLKISASQESPYFFPTKSLVNTEDYPLSRRLLLYKSGRNNGNEYISRFIDFVTSEMGQSIVDNENFVSQKIFIIENRYTSDLPVEYQKATKGLRRLSLNFRLKPMVSNLDSKSYGDLDRLASYIQANDISEVHAIGFSGFTGQNIGFLQNSKSNRQRSVRLAYMIALGLRERGVRNVKTTGLGDIMPLIHEEKNNADVKNARVEIWVKANS